MSKFKVGEIAITEFAPHLADHGVQKYCGEECEIIKIGSTRFIKPEHGQSYDIRFKDGVEASVGENALRKRPQQDDNLFTEWFNQHIITDPIAVPEQQFDMSHVFKSIGKHPEGLERVNA